MTPSLQGVEVATPRCGRRATVSGESNGARVTCMGPMRWFEPDACWVCRDCGLSTPGWLVVQASLEVRAEAARASLAA